MVDRKDAHRKNEDDACVEGGYDNDIIEQDDDDNFKSISIFFIFYFFLVSLVLTDPPCANSIPL